MSRDVLQEIPKNIAAERQVLGYLLQWPEAAQAVTERIRGPSFYLDSHGLIYAACLDLARQSLPVNLLTTGDTLKDRGQLERIGGTEYLARLVDETVSMAILPYALTKVCEAEEQRRYLAFFEHAQERYRRNGTSLDTLRSELRKDLDELGFFASPEVSGKDLSVGADVFLTEPPTLTWDIQGVRLHGDHGWTAAAPKSMKGLWSMEEARALGTGTLFLGKFPARKQRVLWVSEEDRTHRIHYRWYHTNHSRPEAEVPGPDAVRFLIKAGVKLDTDKGVGLLRRHLDSFHPETVILEHWDEFHSMNPNVSEDMKPLLDVLDELHREFGCVFRVQKHTRKVAAGQSKRAGEMIGGTQTLFGWGESSVYLTLIRKGLARVECEAKDGDTAPRFLVVFKDGKLTYGGEVKADQHAEKREAVLQFLAQCPGSTREEVAKGLDVSDRTAGTRLRGLEKDGLVIGKSDVSRQPKRWWLKDLETQPEMVGK